VDVGEGGLLGALLEGLFNAGAGFKGNLTGKNEPLAALFGEVTGRYLVSTNSPGELEKYCRETNTPFKSLGECGGNEVIFDNYKFDLAQLKNCYENSIAKEIEN
jgi:phosphoribosylformylglycinamidine (FGAM) synthase-like enzyme